MSISYKAILYILITFAFFDLYFIYALFVNKVELRNEKRKRKEMDTHILELFMKERSLVLKKHFKKNKKMFLEQISSLKQLVIFDKEANLLFGELISKNKFKPYFSKRLKSFSKYKRMEAAVYLGIIGTPKARLDLEKALKKEKAYAVKLYMINSLVDIGHKDSIPIIISTLFKAPNWYREKVQCFLSEFGKDLYEHISVIRDVEAIEIKELIIDFASVYPAVDLKKYLIQNIEEPSFDQDYKAFTDLTALANEYEDRNIVHKAVDSLSKFYYEELDNEKFIYHIDPYVRGVAVRSLGKTHSKDNLLRLISLLQDKIIKKHTVFAISEIIMNNPQFITLLIQEFNKMIDPSIKNGLAEILENRIEYLLLKLDTKEQKDIRVLIKDIMILEKNSAIIGFLNENKNIETENQIMSIFKEAIKENPRIEEDFCTYLNDRILNKYKFTRIAVKNTRKKEKKDKKTILTLYFLIFFIVLIFPIIYCLRHQNILYVQPFIEQLKIYVLDFNYYIAFYSMAINSIYLMLLFFSFLCILKQSKYWSLKKVTFLFKKRLLPPISIIAPAFNEEPTIIDSVNSLLNLKYPDYELIVVNDGSKDNTLEKLISYYALEKVDAVIDYKLKTMPVRGIYLNKSQPKLIVVDKENGGKADSLNTGINMSTKQYFCGIDADSLLETDSLLKLTSLIIDQEVECPALGGNVFPINGCSVERGMVSALKIPEDSLAIWQTIEYVRAFMAGRLGWAYIDSLLIISGAFGLFKKQRVIETGGYLTSSGKYHKDTVGEDMELVVRLSRYMIENKKKFKVNYSYNANCWTQVPESYKILKGQRDRWHRGLIDIMTFHKKIIGNPTYGRMGLIGFPYFFIFEMMGPLVEIQGYVMVVLAAIFGLLNAKIALLLFITTIFMGVLISISSILLLEIAEGYFTIKEVFVLIFYAIIENFGPRQWVSLWRVGGYINSLKKPKGWGKMERKSFAKTSNIDA